MQRYHLSFFALFLLFFSPVMASAQNIGPQNEAESYPRLAPWPLIRLGFGASTPVNRAAENASGFNFDTSIGPRWALGKRFNVIPELGYAYGDGDNRNTHLALVGIGPELNPLDDMALLIRYAPRFAFGARGSDLSFGLRHGMALSVYSMVGLEVSHQMLRPNASSEHELVILGTIDPSVLLAPFALLFSSGPGVPIH